MAYGFLIDPDKRQYGAWKMGYIVDGSNPIQAWMLLPPYVLGLEASDEPSNDPDSGAGSSFTAVPDNPAPAPTGS